VSLRSEIFRGVLICSECVSFALGGIVHVGDENRILALSVKGFGSLKPCLLYVTCHRLLRSVNFIDMNY
jgi:hypothetical protein